MPARVAAIIEQSWHRVPGGTAASTIGVLGAIHARADWDVIGVAAAHRAPPQSRVAPPVPVCHMGLGRRVLYESWHRRQRPLIQRRTGPVDVVHATGGVIPPAGDAALVVTIHDLAFFHRPDHFTTRGVRFLTRAFDLANRHADIVIVPSAVSAADCRDHGLDDDRLRVVPWGVEAQSVDDELRAEVRDRYRLPGEFMLWVGTAEPRKNLAGLLQAVERMDADVPLLLVGPRGWGVDIDSLVAGSGGTVRHLGEVPTRDRGALYDLADVFVYPSLMEGFGMPVLEAMAQGTAVLTSAATATAEVAGSTGRLVDPNDVDSIVEGIDELWRDRELRLALGDAGRQRAAELTWARTAEATVAAYEVAQA